MCPTFLTTFNKTGCIKMDFSETFSYVDRDMEKLTGAVFRLALTIALKKVKVKGKVIPVTGRGGP
jgi:hypothetical protein